MRQHNWLAQLLCCDEIQNEEKFESEDETFIAGGGENSFIPSYQSVPKLQYPYTSISKNKVDPSQEEDEENISSCTLF